MCYHRWPELVAALTQGDAEYPADPTWVVGLTLPPPGPPPLFEHMFDRLSNSSESV
jgi:hypothetical protein